MRRINAAICTFLFVVSIAAMLGHDPRPVHADEMTAVDPDELGFAIQTVDRGGVDETTSIALDSNDHPQISYYKDIFDGAHAPRILRHACYNGSSWIFETIDSDVLGIVAQCSLDLDSNDYPHISYTVEEDEVIFLKYAYFDGGSWIIQIIDEDCLMPSIAVDSRNNPHISYRKCESKTLRYAHYNGTSWLYQNIDSYESCSSQSMTLDSNDNPHVAYSKGPNTQIQSVHYAYYNGTSWNIETVDSENVGYCVSIALDSQNNPHISYRNSPRGLKYAYFDGASWNIQKVPGSDGDNVYENSIALDSKGNPHISYLNRTDGLNSTIRYAYNNSVSWSIKTVDSERVSGLSNSIALDSRDYPHISYLYSSSLRGNDLRIAILGVPPNVKLGSAISISLSSSTSYVGFKVEIKGNLTYVGFKVARAINGSLTFYEVGPSGAPILLSYSVTSGESWNDITLANTNSDGSYSAVWMPSATGNYLVRAVWAGNFTYPGAATTVNLAVIPLREQNVFSVTSNSTVSELAFNSTSRELSFTVTGPSGTTGYVNVYVAKSLVDNVADVKVYLDGDQLDYTATSLDDSWHLHFTYRHSTHTISISLGPAPFIPPQLTTPLSLGILAIALAVAAVLLILKIRRGTPPTILNGLFRK